MLTALFIPMASGVINGFSEPCFRWLFIFTYFNIFVACRYLNNTNLINEIVLRNSLIIEIVAIVLMFALGLLCKGYTISGYKTQLFIFVLAIVFVLANYYCIVSNKNYVIICIIELCLFSYMYGQKSLITSVSKDDVDKVTSVLADNNDYHNLKDYLNSLDSNNENEYFRVYIPYESLYWSFSHDLGIIYNISGLMTYDSTYAQSFNLMKKLNYNQIVEVLDWEFNIKDTNLINFLSTKYSITTNEDEIPFYNYEIVDNEYRGSLIVALNLDYREIVSTYDKSITYDELKEKYNNDTSLLDKYVVIKDGSVSVGSDESACNNVTYYDNYFGCDLYTDEDGFAVIGIPYDDGWKITVNGDEIDYIECNGGVIGVNVNGGKNHIEMYFVPKGYKTGMIFSGIGFLCFAILAIIDMKRRKTHEQNRR